MTRQRAARTTVLVMLTASFQRDYISRFLPALPPAELSDYIVSERVYSPKKDGVDILIGKRAVRRFPVQYR